MIKVTKYKGQKVGVFGLGKAGEAAVAALVAGGAEVFAWDDRLSDESGHNINYKNWDWQNLKVVVLSPGVPLTHPEPHEVVKLANNYNVPITGEVELLYCTQPLANYIGITGTNGKSTTTTLIGHILKEIGVRCEVGGNLGTPALALEPLGSEEYYVIEMSSYQLDLMPKEGFSYFDAAVLLNITPDHIDRHGDMAGYIKAKMHIFDRQNGANVAVVAVDDEYTKKISKELADREAEVIEVSSQRELAAGIYVKDGILCDGGYRFDLNNIAALTGKHNWQNAAAAYAAVKSFGIDPERIYAAMQSFGGLRHRLQLVDTINGVRFINDSKATNADATQNALAPYKNILWIAGGKAKAGGIESLGEYFSHVKHALLIGDAAQEFARTLEGKVAYTQCGTLEVAVEKAASMAKSGEVVLLSPACASFDQFKSFEHRGDVFCEIVENIGKKALKNAS